MGQPIWDLTGLAHVEPVWDLTGLARPGPVWDLTGLDWEPGTRFTEIAKQTEEVCDLKMQLDVVVSSPASGVAYYKS